MTERPPIKVMPSMLAADLGALREEMGRCEAAGADGLHLDIMDGHFVPNLSFGPSVVALAHVASPLHRNVHLMLSRPDNHAQAFIDAGAQTLSVHVEADCDIASLIAFIRDAGVRPGLVANPDTPVDDLWPHLDDIDEMLFMTVYPGFGGQDFIPEVLPKVSAVRARYPELDISVDGGIDAETGRRSILAGANLLHAGTWLFRSGDLAASMQGLRETTA